MSFRNATRAMAAKRRLLPVRNSRPVSRFAKGGCAFDLLFSAVGGVARFLDVFPPTIADSVAEVAGIIIIAIVIWDFMEDYGKKAAVLHSISIACAEYELRLRSLWMSLEHAVDVDEPAIHAELRTIEDGMLRLTAHAGQANVAEHDRDNKRAAEEAYQVISDRFASEGGSNG